MPATSEDLISFAEELDKSSGETALRASISRAYYGAYHRSVEWERTLPVRGSSAGPDGGIHQQLINRLKNPAPESSSVSMKSRSLAYRLTQLKLSRVSADYDLVAAITEADASAALVNARKLLDDYPA
jgi:hypothetical protein